MPSRVPGGRRSEPAASGSPETDAGMSYSTQWTQVTFGALGSGSSRNHPRECGLVPRFDRDLGLQALEITPDARDRQRLPTLPEPDRTRLTRHTAVYVDVVPLLRMLDILDSEIV